MTQRKSQADHDNMVKDTVAHLVNNGYSNMNADIAGYDSPAKIQWKNEDNGHIPDIDAKHKVSGKRIIAEIETEDSIDIQHTKDQWKLFSAFCQQNQSTFIVVVPEGSEPIASKVLEEIGAEATIWTL